MRLGIALGLLSYFVFPLGLELLTSERKHFQAIGKTVTLAGAGMFFVGMLLAW